MAGEEAAATALGGLGAAFIGLMVVFMGIVILIAIAFYIYHALVMSTIARKLNHPNPWMAWIPFANIAQVLQLGNFHWAFVFLILLPIFGWIALAVLVYISMWRIFEARKYPGYLSLLPVIGLVIFPIQMVLGFIPIIGAILSMILSLVSLICSIGFLVVLGLVAWKDR